MDKKLESLFDLEASHLQHVATLSDEKKELTSKMAERLQNVKTRLNHV